MCVTCVQEITDSVVCREYWPSPASRKYFTVASLVLQYIIPGFIMTFCYTKVTGNYLHDLLLYKGHGDLFT